MHIIISKRKSVFIFKFDGSENENKSDERRTDVLRPKPTKNAFFVVDFFSFQVFDGTQKELDENDFIVKSY